MKSWNGRREKIENSYSGGLESHQKSGPNNICAFSEAVQHATQKQRVRDMVWEVISRTHYKI